MTLNDLKGIYTTGAPVLELNPKKLSLKKSLKREMVLGQ